MCRKTSLKQNPRHVWFGKKKRCAAESVHKHIFSITVTTIFSKEKKKRKKKFVVTEQHH